MKKKKNQLQVSNTIKTYWEILSRITLPVNIKLNNKLNIKISNVRSISYTRIRKIPGGLRQALKNSYQITLAISATHSFKS